MVQRTLTVLLALLALPCLAQSPNPQPMATQPVLPIVSFDFLLEGSAPPHYSIAVAPDGKATYRADEPPGTAGVAPQEPYLRGFLVSDPTRSRIFDLARALQCFQGKFEYRGGRIANMGAKTLKCTWADRESQTTYNYSTNPRLQELTNLFQNISNTMEHSRQLDYLHRHEKLGLEAELKYMEEEEKTKRLEELQAVAPQLERIVSDSSILNVTRRRAEHLLQIIKSNPTARAGEPQ